MSNTNLTEYGRYLTSLAGHSINATAPERPFEGMDWARLYWLAHFHNVTALVYPAVAALDVPADILNKFKYDCNRLMAREARQEIESARVFSALSAKGISFIKLKGIVIKNLYPLPYMRTLADVDICMSREDRERARTIMEKLGYEFDSGIDYHDEYSKDKFFIYELHSSVTSTRSDFYDLFASPFEKAQAASDGTGMVFNDEYFYLHLITHLYKHFVSEGCGIRLFCDLYVYERTHPKLNMDFIRKMLSEYGIEEFYDTIRNLTDCLFSGRPLEGKYTAIANFVFKSGEYGSAELKRISWISSDKTADLKFKDKWTYFLQNWFPGVKTLKKRYPILEKAPVLLPVCWLRRGFYTLFFKRSALKEQHNEIKKMNSDEMKEARKVRFLAGIK